MTLSLYTEGVLCKGNDPLLLNGIIIHPDSKKIFLDDSSVSLFKNNTSESGSVIKKVEIEEKQKWILTDKGVHRCIGTVDRQSYSSTTIFYSSQYHDAMCRAQLFKESCNKIMVTAVTREQLESMFYLIKVPDTSEQKDNCLSIEYSVEIFGSDGVFNENKRYFKHDIIERSIRDYVVKNSIALTHDQIFIVGYKNEEVTHRETLLLIKLSLVANSRSKKELVNASLCSGIIFDSILSRNVVFKPSTESLKTNVYLTDEKISSMEISWVYLSVEDTYACNFVDVRVLKSMIFAKLDCYAIKIGQTFKLNTKGGTIIFKITSVNGVKEDDNTTDIHTKSLSESIIKSKIYYLSEFLVDSIYDEPIIAKNTTNILINIPDEKLLSGFVSVDLSNMVIKKQEESPLDEDLTDEADRTRLSKIDDKIDLVYDPTLHTSVSKSYSNSNGNVVYIDSQKDFVKAQSITVDVRCISTTKDYLLWRSHYTDVVRELLVENRKIGATKLQKTIDGEVFIFKITDCVPRVNYVVGRTYQPTHGVYFDDNTTDLKIVANATKKGDKTSTFINVIFTDDENMDGDCTDEVVSVECVIKKMTNGESQSSNYSSQKKDSDEKNTLMIEECRLIDDILKTKTVWEGRTISLVVPQYSVTISITFTKIQWKYKKETVHNDKSLRTDKRVHVGDLLQSTKIKWILPNDIFIVSDKYSYTEKTFQEVANWTKQNKIGGLNSILWQLYRHLVVLRNPNTIDVLKKNGLKPSKGVILYGPPGNGKTKLARCIGKLLGSRDENIILCSATELLSKWIGESEKNVARLFAPAEQAYELFGSRAPLYTIIIDEIDIIAQRRGSCSDSSGVREGMVNQLLTKIDGLIEKDNIILIGLTNREKILDPALLREGRLDRMVCVNLPTEEGRREILDMYISPWIKPVVNEEIKSDTDIFIELDDLLDILTKKTVGFSGADLQGYVSYVVSEYWSSLLGVNVSECDRQYIPRYLFLKYLDLYIDTKDLKNAFE